MLSERGGPSVALKRVVIQNTLDTSSIGTLKEVLRRGPTSAGLQSLNVGTEAPAASPLLPVYSFLWLASRTSSLM